MEVGLVSAPLETLEVCLLGNHHLQYDQVNVENQSHSHSQNGHQTLTWLKKQQQQQHVQLFHYVT